MAGAAKGHFMKKQNSRHGTTLNKNTIYTDLALTFILIILSQTYK
jgi:hypothetical protein